MKSYLIVGFLIMAKCTFCQTNSSACIKIDSIAAHIDSLKDYYLVAEDGTVEIKRKGVFKKVFAKRIVGGFSDNYYSDKKTKELYKVVHTQHLRKRQTEIYYYFNNGTLILAKIKTVNDVPIDKVLSSGQFYFLGDSLIQRTGNDTLAKPIFILKNGKDLLKGFYSEKSDLAHYH